MSSDEQPEKPITLNLDALEREGEIPEPFTFQHENRVYTLFDPQEVDWQELLSGLRNPALFVRYAMPLADQKEFFSKKVPAWKMNKLMQGYTDHFDLPDLGNVNALRT